MMQIGMAIVRADEDDRFYFRNKRVIYGIGESLAATTLTCATIPLSSAGRDIREAQ